ncbi:hypothetical protein [Pseudobacteriovorax antillogorgiicola]|uniref:Porin n=1 Tax=Pseudobacteriovorax antillogorgiicola TaxID=1513793 RepID=A0A1Y6BEK8_9BACT|nr:hypothetical protein [Pseudobacteriovorax antillogorgiicola]TCS56321.1 hypothetical protein EDD56_104143 [Pseudobacteriovorax antillogorgiicola]SMF07088.1 hypothetical protein SAMN06296036_104190 [Pseudobacteriovorax antillogorgiicola]
MRNQYGRWNGNRWLTMFRSKSLRSKPLPKSFPEQTYNLDTDVLQELITTDDLHPEQIYDRRDRREHVTAAHRRQFEMNIPKDDPYYYLGNSVIDGGIDLRYLSLKRERAQKSFLMNMDFGVRYRPYHRHLNLVYESRFLGSPDDQSPEESLNRQTLRSLYILFDDLPYNTFLQYGYFLPLFGNYTSDHTSLPQQMFSSAITGSPQGAYGISFKALSLGTAPNVPFANVHGFSQVKDGDQIYRHKGYALNIGLRFVTLGGTVNYSFWRSDLEHANGDESDLAMHSLNLAMQLGFNRVYLSFEGLVIEKDSSFEFIRISLQNYQARVRLWRESYLELDYSQANGGADLQPGKTTQVSHGLRAFLLPGVDWSLKVVHDRFEGESQPVIYERTLLSHIHLYL